MFSIAEAKYAHTHAIYNIPVGVRREWGSVAIIQELETEAVAVHHARIGKLQAAVMKLYPRIMGSLRKSAPTQQVDSEAALGTGN